MSTYQPQWQPQAQWQPPTPVNLPIAKQARWAANIFYALGVVVFVGGLLALTAEGIALIYALTEGGGARFVALVMVSTAIGTGLTWANVTLATIVAGYIAQRAA